MKSKNMLSNSSVSTKAWTSSSCSTKYVRAWWCKDRRSDPGHVRARLFWLEIPDGQVQVQGGAQARKTTAHLPPFTWATRSEEGEELQNSFLATSGKSLSVIIGGDLNTSAPCECGKAKVSSIEEAWEETLLIPPPDLVPMWSQMKDSGGCCGFRRTKKNVTNWRVAKHGSLQFTKEKPLPSSKCNRITPNNSVISLPQHHVPLLHPLPVDRV